MIIQPTRQVLRCALLFSVVAFATTAAARQIRELRTYRGRIRFPGAGLYKQYCAVCHGSDLKRARAVSH